MFAMKNIILRIKTGKQIRGRNKEAIIATAFFVLFIVVAVIMSFFKQSYGGVQLLNSFFVMTLGLAMLFLSLIVSSASLINLKDSWRVGVIEDQKTVLITTGIYRYTRNPYFVSYILMFAAYTILLQNIILLGLSIIGFLFVHKMILKEEKYLFSMHGDTYTRYKRKVPRYIIL